MNNQGGPPACSAVTVFHAVSVDLDEGAVVTVFPVVAVFVPNADELVNAGVIDKRYHIGNHAMVYFCRNVGVYTAFLARCMSGSCDSRVDGSGRAGADMFRA